LLVKKRKIGKKEGKEKVLLFLLKKLKKSSSFPYLFLVFSSSFPKINV
jgi:hypothetical protein